MDDIDRTQDRMEQEMAIFERKRRESPASTFTYYRFCLYCTDETTNGEAYCCDECRIDAERLQNAKRRNGK